MTIKDFKFGDIVKPATETDAFAVSRGVYGKVSTATRFIVAVIVEQGMSYGGKQSGLIVVLETHPGHGHGYPYIWDANRFVKA